MSEILTHFTLRFPECPGKPSRTQQTVADEIRRNWTPEPRGRLVAVTRNPCVHGRLRQEGRVRHGVRRALLALQGLAVQLRVPRLRGLDVPQALQAALLLQRLRRQARNQFTL